MVNLLGKSDLEFPQARILVFCRAPIAGRVKTRLVPSLGEQGAASLHEELALARIRMSIEARLAPVELWCEPTADFPFFRQFEPRALLQPQAGADLGERMTQALATSLARPGVTRAVLIGTDCPDLDRDYLALALSRLRDHDAVIGPAEDGGYGLIGLGRPSPEVFQQIAWGTDTVLGETCRAFNRARLNFALLPLIWDVDRPADVDRYRAYQALQAGGAS